MIVSARKQTRFDKLVLMRIAPTFGNRELVRNRSRADGERVFRYGR